MKTLCLCRVLVVLAFYVLGHSAGAEDLGFPRRCVELQKVPSDGLSFDVFSSRDSVLFRLITPARSTKETILSFVVWDTETGEWLTRRQAPGPLPANWQLSPDGKLLAIPIYGPAKVIQLWEVGAKDLHGVPQLQLVAKLRRPDVSPKEPPDNFSPQFSGRLAWTSDSKTLIAGYGNPRNFWNAQILSWSFTDKPSVLSDSPPDDRESKGWKPWAKLDFDGPVTFTVSPDNRTLAVLEMWKLQDHGHLFDLQSAELREKFKIDRPPKSGAHAYMAKFSPDSKTLVLVGGGDRYFTLWDTAPPALRVDLDRPDFREYFGLWHSFAFTSDSQWLLTRHSRDSKDAIRRQGGVVQVRDPQTGNVRQEVSFPEQLGLLASLDDLAGQRVLLRFESKKGHRQFLWHADDLLRYAVEHGTPPR